MAEKTITIYMKNDSYGKSLGKGLCYMDAGLEIFFADSLEEAIYGMKKGVILTDYEMKDDPRIIKVSNSDKLHPLECLAQKIRLAFRNTYKVELYKDKKNTKVIGVFSNYGGQGVTSFSITLSRLISIKTDKNVLYLSLDKIDDSHRYTNSNSCYKSSKEEYFFMKEEGLEVNFREYLLKDQWNVNYFAHGNVKNFFGNENGKSRILDYIKSEDYFDYIIIDFGKIPLIEQREIDKKIQLVSQNLMQDLSTEPVEDVLKVINFSEFSGGNGKFFYVKNSIESFVKIDGKIDISMESEFAESVEKFVETNELMWLDWEKRMQIMSE